MKEVKEKTFTNSNGETMRLQDIIAEDKKIISVTFRYLNNKRYLRANGLWGKLGFKKEVWDQKIEKIYSKDGINLKIKALTFSISFSSKEEYDKIKNDYDVNTMWKQDTLKMVPSNRYCIDFIPNNLIDIDWKERRIF